ncbi:hypothetical protein [Mucilaginibacter sp. PPCGB 2223]|uniref:hypothetical protein n=1 Tax=Mucilaginibacter sp. PPCGB 2223 TaxID=1886027 RepID=UPI0020C7BEE4|nr:hypothetical protein [Mucilaginibacter sp. PPCGB 2223]
MSTINLPAYFETIKKKTGKRPEDFKLLAEEKGWWLMEASSRLLRLWMFSIG